MSDPAADLVRRFPGLAGTGFRVTSPESRHYNCIAWAVHETRRWISPELYHAALDLHPWPAGVARADTLDAWTAALGAFGFVPCADAAPEPAREKVAIYAKAAVPVHVARQLPSGRWTSKIGRWEDIEHALHALEGERYGRIVRFLQRPRAVVPSPPDA